MFNKRAITCRWLRSTIWRMSAISRIVSAMALDASQTVWLWKGYQQSRKRQTLSYPWLLVPVLASGGRAGVQTLGGSAVMSGAAKQPMGDLPGRMVERWSSTTFVFRAAPDWPAPSGWLLMSNHFWMSLQWHPKGLSAWRSCPAWLLLGQPSPITLMAAGFFWVWPLPTWVRAYPYV